MKTFKEMEEGEFDSLSTQLAEDIMHQVVPVDPVILMTACLDIVEASFQHMETELTFPELLRGLANQLEQEERELH